MSYNLRILTPEGPIFDDTVDTVQATGYKGSFGVLTGHAPMITALLVGPGKVITSSGTQWYVFGEGTLEVRKPDVVMLVDFAEKVDSYEAAKKLTAEDAAGDKD
ncbi:MAG: F0F1 ATP synthase subunit epsilon [Verrucomicrobia bacterium]|nr:F0F1 ATP synthase subunit epsilon [Verrucomicrobiota bacterium]MCH8511994.1 F0F1 ATP synthase subunit epsilon [Kiritimatiellia bacterium]